MAKPVGGELDSASRSGGQRWQAEVAEGAAARARVPIRRLPTPWRRVAEAAAEAALPVRPQVWPEVLASCAPCLQTAAAQAHAAAAPWGAAAGPGPPAGGAALSLLQSV